MQTIRFAAPLPVHIPFHQSTADIKVAIGGVGSGKSRALCVEAHRFALAQPGSEMILTRRTIPDLKRSTERELFESMPAGFEERLQISRSGGHVETITYPNHSKLWLIGMEDWNKQKSMNLAWIGIDEASEQTRDNFEGILTRLRQPRPLKGAAPLRRGERMKAQMCLASNPNGRDWLYECFVDPKTRRPDSSIHLSTPMDNPYLNPDYLDRLLQMPTPFVRRFVECHFDAAAGRIYDEWAWDTHVVPVKEPGGYGSAIWMTMDPGILNPTAGLWLEVDRVRQRLVAVAEYQEPGRAAPEHAAAWRGMEAKMKPARVVRRIADPNITKRDQGTTMELSDIYARLGYNFEKGPVRDDVRIPALANAIATYSFVCTEACPMLFEQINSARWEEQAARLRDLGDYKERMRKGNDHLHDCAQYAAAAHVLPPRRVIAKPEEDAAVPSAEEVDKAFHAERLKRHRAHLRNGPRRTAEPGVIFD